MCTKCIIRFFLPNYSFYFIIYYYLKYLRNLNARKLYIKFPIIILICIYLVLTK